MSEQETKEPAGDANAEVAALRERAESAERELVVRRALKGIDWLDAEDAYRELAARTERDAEGKWNVALPNGTARAANGEQRLPVAYVSPEEAARELAARKPHWVRARVMGGTGAGGDGAAAGRSAGVTYAELLKPENGGLLREYLHDRPEELERMRQAHFGRSN